MWAGSTLASCSHKARGSSGFAQQALELGCDVQCGLVHSPAGPQANLSAGYRGAQGVAGSLG